MPRRLLKPSASLSWRMALVIFSALAGITYAVFVRQDRLGTERQSQAIVSGTAQLIARHAAGSLVQTIDGLRLLAQRVAEADVEAPGVRERFRDAFEMFVAGSEAVGTMWSVAGDGSSLMDNSRARPEAPPVTHRAYFRAHAAGEEVHIGERAAGTVSRRPRFTVSVRMKKPSGEFAGCIVAGMDVAFFERLYESSRQASGVDAMMLREDGAVLASWPGDQPFEIDPAWMQSARTLPTEVQRVDEIFRIERVADLPVYVFARLDTSAAVQGWRERALLAVVPLTVSILAFGWLARRGLVAVEQIERARFELEGRVKERTQEIATLYDELNHRVKNNLQLVSSLVRIGATNVVDPTAALELRQTSQRIEALADVHRLLEDTTSDVPAAVFCRRIVERLRDSFLAPGQAIAVSVDIPDDVRLSSGDAVSFGVILNEVVTNAFKHAFRGRSAGSIAIRYERAGQEHGFTVADNGIGLRPDAPRSTGGRVTDAMVTKLGGMLTATSAGEGTTVTINFPAR